MKKIVVPIDFSETSKNALAFACEVAKKVNGEIILLHSIDTSLMHQDYFVQFSVDEYIAKLIRATKEKLHDITKLVATGIAYRTHVCPGALTDVLQDTCKEISADLVIMGTKGSDGLEEIFVGSNTEKAVRRLSCPVISVPGPASFTAIEKIVIPLDLDEIKRSFLQEISQLQKTTKAHLAFLWIKTPHNVENEELVVAELKKLLDNEGLKNYSFTVLNAIFPMEGILTFTEKTEANLVAMGTHARKGLSHLLSGSLTEDTVNHINVPVWTFKLDKKEHSIAIPSVPDDGTPITYRQLDLVH